MTFFSLKHLNEQFHEIHEATTFYESLFIYEQF
jgi:hypothetical protein